MCTAHAVEVRNVSDESGVRNEGKSNNSRRCGGEPDEVDMGQRNSVNAATMTWSRTHVRAGMAEQLSHQPFHFCACAGDPIPQ